MIYIFIKHKYFEQYINKQKWEKERKKERTKEKKNVLYNADVSWETSDWSDCSKTCGFSYKSQTRKCLSGCDSIGNNSGSTTYKLCSVTDCGYYGNY